MIKLAKKKIRKSCVKVLSEIDDIRKSKFGNRLGAITCFFSSISNDLTSDDVENAMSGIYRGLRRGGVFITDVPKPRFKPETFPRASSITWRITQNRY